MELIRCYMGIYKTSRKTVSGGFLWGKKEENRTRFLYVDIYKIFGNKITQQAKETDPCQDFTLFS